MAFQTVSHITVDGDLELTAVRFEDPPPEVVPGGMAPAPSSGYIMPMAYDSSPQPAIYPSVHPPAYSAYAPSYQPQTYIMEDNQVCICALNGCLLYLCLFLMSLHLLQPSGGRSNFGSMAAGAAAGMAIGGLGGYALSRALDSDSHSDCSD